MRLLQEMRRRSVFRVMGLYIVGAWLVLQVGATLFPAWGIPDAGLNYLFLAAIVGFPIAIIFGWLYEITPDGIVRTLPAGQDDTVDFTLKRADYAILAALGVMALVVIYGGFERIAAISSDEQVAAEHLPNSVAIMPFVNLDTGTDTDYFSDGVTEEILHKLSSFQQIHVVGQSSSFAFKNSDLTPQKVVEVLGVSFLLRGSIRREMDRVRVRASLLDQAGLQVWSGSFDREVRGIFAVQSEIANLVAREMVAEIAPREIEPGSTTDNTEAYEAYLIGLDYLRSRTLRYASNAEEVFRKAVELDPDFAPAHAGLAITIGLKASSNLGEYSNILETAQSHVVRALELVPDLAMAHAAQGLLLEFGQQADFVAAEKALRRAIELDPTIVNAYNWLQIALRSQGRVDEAVEVMKAALEIDPLNPIINSNVATGYSRRGDFRGAERRLLRLMDLPQPPGTVYVSLHQLYADYGRYAKALEWLHKRILAYGGEGDSWGLSNLGNVYLELGMDEEADYWIDRSIERDSQPVNGFFRNVYRLKVRGEYPRMLELMDELSEKHSMDVSRLTVFAAEVVGAIYLMNEDYEAGIPILEGIIDPDETLPNMSGGTTTMLDFMYMLVHAYRQTGRDDEAALLLEKCARHIEQLESDFQVASPGFVMLKVLHHVMLGDMTTGARHFEEAVDNGWRQFLFMEHDPRWAGFFAHPAAQSQLAFVRADIERQREAIRSSGVDAEFRAAYDEMLQAAD